MSWLHTVRRDVDPRTRGISHFATGTTYIPMTLAFAALALALAAIAYSTPRSPGAAFLWLAAVGMGAVAAIPVPGPAAPRWQGPAHTLSALLYLITVAVGAVMVSRPAGGLGAALAWVVAVAVIVFLAGMANAPGLFPIRGWLQRVSFGAVVAWLLATGARALLNRSP